MAAEVIITAGELPPPACGYANDQERLEAYVSAMEAVVDGDLQWQASIEEPDDLTLFWLQLDSDERPIAVLKYSEADARWVRWRMTPATDGTVGGTPDAITLTFTNPFSAATAYQEGRQYVFLADSDNVTGAVTFNVDGVGAVAVTKYGGSALVPGDIQAGQMVVFVANGTTIEFINPRIVPPEAQFLTYVSGLETIPASGSTQIFPHGFVDGVNGVLPHMVRVVVVRTAAATDTILFAGGGSMNVSQDQELDSNQFWSGRRGVDNETFSPVFLIRSDDVNVYVTAYYPRGIAIPAYDNPLTPNSDITQQITGGDYSLKVYATAINPDF